MTEDSNAGTYRSVVVCWSCMWARGARSREEAIKRKKGHSCAGGGAVDIISEKEAAKLAQ